jgi:hypothetical protein
MVDNERKLKDEIKSLKSQRPTEIRMSKVELN